MGTGHITAEAFHQRYEALSRVSRAIHLYRDPKELLRVLAEELRTSVNFSLIGLYLYDEKTNRVYNPVLETVRGPGFAIPDDFPAEDTITWSIYRHGEAVVIASSDKETRFPRMMEVYRTYGVQSACLLPLATAHRRLGTLLFAVEEENGYAQDDVRYLSLVADHVALAVDNALRDEEQRQAETELRKQKAHLEQLFELAPEAIVLRDIENRILSVNREFSTLFGYTQDEAVGRSIIDLIVPEDRRMESERMRAGLKRGERINAELIRRRKDGTLLDVSLVAAPVSVGTEVAAIYAIYRDISERKRAEAALRRSEAYLAEGQRLSHTGSLARNVATGEVFLSQESIRMFGLDPEAARPTLEDVFQRVHSEDVDTFRNIVRAALVGKSDFEYGFRVVLADGRIRHVQVTGHPVTNAAGVVVEFVGTHMDVTEQRQSRAALEKALEGIKELRDQLYEENVALRREIDETAMFEEIIGKSEVLRSVLKQIEAIAPTDSTVLIHGETGTGKELIARAIHNLSPRRPNAFAKLNCASIPTGLMESELFGHEKGAFTGAIAQRVGRFELANHGTIFLDEVGEIPLELQPKLLRVLQEREFERLGSSRTLHTDVRLIAATNRDLAAMVEEQKFRSDLYYRLNVIPIRVPALRERPEDVPLLVRHFAELFSRRMNKPIRKIPAATMDALVRYQWPGNVRELQNIIERAVILSEGGVLRVPMSDLADDTRSRKPFKAASAQNREGNTVPGREQIVQALKESKGQVGGADGAAARLGLKRTTLIAYMKRLDITPRTVINHF
ncbi:sigma 54-interacting transcriptional regulator [Paludibaculum fermentans]|uniref:Sigma 54-interacting transcriptional regulator n=1 Tax=Paludibaculum fermentans TaxID=1473598 RepID=A0A7S7NXR3_PALFE|nr:sigma 54-interacting transcriptional regulator [Paludibaculum fermentans]QOY91707.1 sigma 54-interacting transcriptional regulator [Paludibaculum fermentans]